MPGQLYTFVLPPKLKTELEKICNEEHEPLSVVIRRAIKEFLRSKPGDMKNDNGN